MPDRRWAKCRICNARREDVGELSWTGLCPSCGRSRLEENIDGLHTFTGAPLERWRRGMAASVGAILLDDVLPPA